MNHFLMLGDRNKELEPVGDSGSSVDVQPAFTTQTSANQFSGDYHAFTAQKFYEQPTEASLFQQLKPPTTPIRINNPPSRTTPAPAPIRINNLIPRTTPPPNTPHPHRATQTPEKQNHSLPQLTKN